MYRFEIISLIVTALFIIIALEAANDIDIGIPRKIEIAGLWFMTGMFLLNTIGNAISKNKLEQKVFTPVTIVLAAFSGILALSY